MTLVLAFVLHLASGRRHVRDHGDLKQNLDQVSPEYFKFNQGAAKCPHDAQMTSSQCEAAAIYFGKEFATGSWVSRPAGCFDQGTTGVLFNTNIDGDGHDGLKPLCLQAIPVGYRYATSNCDCGTTRSTIVAGWPSGHETAEQCAAQCTAQAACVSFAVRTEGGHTGLCTLFSKYCTSTCDGPNNGGILGTANHNMAFNKEAADVVVVKTMGEDCPTGYRPMSQEECERGVTMEGIRYNYIVGGCSQSAAGGTWPDGCFRNSDGVYYNTCKGQGRTYKSDYGVCAQATCGANTNNDGAELSRVLASSSCDCRQRCVATPACKAFTFSIGMFTTPNYNCFLRHWYGSPVNNCGSDCFSGLVREAYHLAPEGANSCDAGSTPAEKECEEAADQLVQALGHAQGLGGLVARTWHHVPFGCSVQSGGDWAAHFNRNSYGKNDDTYSLVCSGQAPTSVPTAAPTRALTPAPTPASVDWDFTAYNDQGSCGKRGNDYQWAWCNKFVGGYTAENCAPEVMSSKCSSGVATFESYQSKVKIDGCYYFHLAQYRCKQALWTQTGQDNSKCPGTQVPGLTQLECQEAAVADGKEFYSWAPEACIVATKCANPITGTTWAWKVFEKPEADPMGYSLAGSNCNCGETVHEMAQGYETADACASQCTFEPRCKSFGLWNQKGAGLCRLFDKACLDTCPSPTGFAGGWKNTVYNKGESAFAINGKGSNDCPSGATPLTLSECRVAATHYGLLFQREEELFSFPAGCYVQVDSTGVWFNTHAVGRARSSLAPICATAPLPQATYVEGTVGSRACPAGSVALTEHGCEQAAGDYETQFLLISNGAKSYGEATYPPGCYMRASLVYFNPYFPGGVSSEDRRMICKAPTPAPTPEPTEAPTEAPTPAPTPEPTEAPTAAPTPEPMSEPTPARRRFIAGAGWGTTRRRRDRRRRERRRGGA